MGLYNAFRYYNFGVEFWLVLLSTAMVILLCLPVHEFAHGFVAKKLGDPTAENRGRLSLNPFMHLDPIGSISILLFGFGWAKPVPVNPFFFKDPKKGMALTALAGPVSNILLGTLILIIYKIIAYFIPVNDFTYLLGYVLQNVIHINVSLAVFNLLPIPPLDGSKIMALFLPERIMNLFYKNERIITMILFAVIWLTPILNYPISIASNFILKGMDFITGFIEIIAGLI